MQLVGLGCLGYALRARSSTCGGLPVRVAAAVVVLDPLEVSFQLPVLVVFQP